MEATQIIILTSIVNVIISGLVGGIVIYVLQKKIESSFAEKLEEFKAQLQYSNFEQQTRFAIIHARRAETLETLYHRFAHFIEIFHLAFSNSLELQSEVMGDLLDLHGYFSGNRLFLPEGMATQIEDLVEKAISLIARAGYAASNHDNQTLFDEIFSKIYDELDAQANTLENLYKSVAEVQ